MTETVAVVLSRYDSDRLPGKALLEINGRPLLGRVLDQLAFVGMLDRVVVATSDRSVDDVIVQFCITEGINVFRGSYRDVLGRVVDCARLLGADRIVRISGDSPFIAPKWVSAAIEHSLIGQSELVTNVSPRTFPRGVSVEVLTIDALYRLDELAESEEDREHVTSFCYRHRDLFTLDNLKADQAWYTSVSLVVDTPEDLARARWIAERVDQLPSPVCLDTVAHLAKEWNGAQP